MVYLIFDVIILILLLLFAIHGARKGLIVSLFSLVSLLVAFVGAVLISNFFAPKAAQWLEPAVAPTIENAIYSALPDDLENMEISAEDPEALFDSLDLPFGLNDILADFFEENPPTLNAASFIDDLVTDLTAAITRVIAYIMLFLISFIVILLIWKLLGRTLDLVSRLPGLNLINKLGGFILGALRCTILLFVLAWIFRTVFVNTLSPELIEQTYLIRFFMTVNPLDYLAKL